MTKAVRIENADTAEYKVRLRVQERVFDAARNEMTDEWRDVLVETLDYPTAMSSGMYLTDSRRIVIEEYR